jgi:cytochrome P450
MLLINMEALHHDPDQWREPSIFCPDRFDPESPWFKKPDGGNRHPMAFSPFLGG